jgi:RES domain-containing protein
LARFCRLTKERYADSAWSGEGAKLYSGRWNPKGVPMVYCASTLSLAALEYFVHVDAVDLPADLVVLYAELPDDAVERLDPSTLPRDWRTVPAPPSLQKIGAEWARSMRSAALAVPSAIVPAESNYLLNPSHAGMSALSAEAPTPFAFDPRMRKTTRKSTV